MSGAPVRASFWNLPVADLAAHIQKGVQGRATAVVPVVRPIAAATAVALSRPRARLTFRGFDDFMPVFRWAREAVIAEHGEKWWWNPDVCRKARVPAAWVTWKGSASGGRSYRDLNFPLGRYWPGGELPIGPNYAAPASVAQFGGAPAPKPRTIDAPAWEWLDAAD